MWESLIPACFADVVAPIPTLCVMNSKGPNWSFFKTLPRAALNDAHDSDLLLENKRSVPGVVPHIARYFIKAWNWTYWVGSSFKINLCTFSELVVCFSVICRSNGMIGCPRQHLTRQVHCTVKMIIINHPKDTPVDYLIHLQLWHVFTLHFQSTLAATEMLCLLCCLVWTSESKWIYYIIV